MGVLDKVKAMRESAKLRELTTGSPSFFSTAPGLLTALGAFITALVSLYGSCNTANKAVLERMDKIDEQCQVAIKTERDTRASADEELKGKIIDNRTEHMQTRELVFEYYRKLEQRVLNVEGDLAKQQRFHR